MSATFFFLIGSAGYSLVIIGLVGGGYYMFKAGEAGQDQLLTGQNKARAEYARLCR